MKKALTIAAIALGVIAAQAAQVSWDIDDVTQGGSKITGSGIAYLFNAANYSATDIKNAIADGTFDTLTHIGGVATIDEEEPGYLTAGKVNDPNIEFNTNYDVFAVVFDGNNTTSGNYIITESVRVKTKGSGSSSFALGSQASNTSWTAVPEPTTVALIALGLAALGLKRKVA